MQLKVKKFSVINGLLISNINRLIGIDCYRLILIIYYRFHRLITPGIPLTGSFSKRLYGLCKCKITYWFIISKSDNEIYNDYYHLRHQLWTKNLRTDVLVLPFNMLSYELGELLKISFKPLTMKFYTPSIAECYADVPTISYPQTWYYKKYSELFPCGHPAITDTRYCGQNLDLSDWKWPLLAQALAIMELWTLIRYSNNNSIVLGLNIVDTMKYLCNIST